MNYTQLTQEQRYQIHALLKMGHQQTEIAEYLEVHKSTISRELRRNKGLRGYRPKQAHQKAMSRITNTPNDKNDPSDKRPVVSEMTRIGMRLILKRTTYKATYIHFSFTVHVSKNQRKE